MLNDVSDEKESKGLVSVRTYKDNDAEPFQIAEWHQECVLLSKTE